MSAYTDVAEIFASEGFDAKAVAIYKQILRIDAAAVAARVRLGDLYQRLGLPSDALREYQAAVKIYQERGQKPEAFELLKRLASLDPTNVPNRLSLADLFLREGLKSEASEAYDSLLADVARGGDLDALERVSRQMLESFPDHAGALGAFAKAKVALGTAAEAAELLRRALPKLPDDIPLREALVTVYEAQGDSAAAQSLYREMAELYKRRGDADRAREILQRFVPVEPFAEHDNTPGADEGFAAAQELGLPPSDVQIELGGGEPDVTPPPPDKSPDDLLAEARVMLDFDNLDDAERAARQVLLLDNASDGGRALLANICHRRGNRAEALRMHEERRGLASALGDAELLAEIEAAIREIDDKGAPVAPPAVSRSRAERAPRPPAEDEEAFEDALTLESLPDIELVLEDTDDDDSLASVEPPTEIAVGRRAAEPPPEPTPAVVRAAEPAPAREAKQRPPRRSKEAEEALSATWGADSSAIAERLEEAEFYLGQGMAEEAERILRAVLEKVPQHPQAMLRLGEIEASREERDERPSKAAAGATPTLLPEPEEEIPSMPELTIEGMEPQAEPKSKPKPRSKPRPKLEPRPEPAPVAVEESEPDPIAESEDEFEVEVDSIEVEVDTPAGVEIEVGDEPAFEEEPAGRDLAAELAVELDADEESPESPEEGGDFDLAAALDDDADSSLSDGDFASVFKAFKKGIEEQLGEDECDAHYDLAIAYREMGLLDDAIRELEIVRRGGRELESLSLMASCELELNRPSKAVEHLRNALKLPEARGESAVPLYYELGSALEAAGNERQALEHFKKVAKSDPEFRDVAERIRQLEGGR